VNPNIIPYKARKTFYSQRRNEKQKLESGYTSTYAILIWLVIFFLVYYIWTLNTNATKSYEIRKLENISEELSNDLERLESTISNLKSSNTILWDDMVQDMEQAYNPEYLVIKKDKQYVYSY